MYVRDEKLIGRQVCFCLLENLIEVFIFMGVRFDDWGKFLRLKELVGKGFKGWQISLMEK